MSNHQSFLELIGLDHKAAESSDHVDGDFVNEVFADEVVDEPAKEEATEVYTLTRNEMVEITQQLTSTQRYTSVHPISESRVSEPLVEANLTDEVSSETDDAAAVNEENPDEATSYENSSYEKTSYESTERVEPTVCADNSASVDLGDCTAIDQALEEGSHGEDEAPQTENKTAHFDYTNDEQAGGRIVVLDGNVNARAFHLGHLPLRLGRDTKNEVIIDDSNVSRFHAEIQESADGVKIVDLQSTNGIKVNGKLERESLLKAHDIVQVGDALFEFLPDGVLSKGLPQSSVMADTASAAPTPRKKKSRLFLVVALLAVAGALALYSQKEAVTSSAVALVGQKVSQELTQLKDILESEAQTKIDQLSPDEAKALFMNKIENSAVLELLPENQREMIANLPGAIVQVVLDDPTLVEKIATLTSDPSKIEAVLSDKLNELIAAKRYRLALGLAKLFSETHPEDKNYRDLVEQLEKVSKQEGRLQSTDELSDDEKQFAQSIEKIETYYQSILDTRDSQAALNHARTVQEKLLEVIKIAPFLETVARAELEKWEGRIVQLELKLRDATAKVEREKAVDLEEGRALEEISLLLNLGEAGKAYEAIQSFLSKHAKSSRVPEVKGKLLELNQMLDQTFAATKIEVERSLQTQTYEQAWKQLYLFSDMAPHYSGAKELKAQIAKVTTPKATQFYNQARVYEFEADDLMAAEQYYKRSFETADPRSELAQKADRRLADVRRKLVR